MKNDLHVIDRADQKYLDKRFFEIAQYLLKKDIFGTMWSMKIGNVRYQFVAKGTKENDDNPNQEQRPA